MLVAILIILTIVFIYTFVEWFVLKSILTTLRVMNNILIKLEKNNERRKF